MGGLDQGLTHNHLKAMSDDDLAHELRSLIPLPPWRYRQCRAMLARQMALREAGQDYQDYFRNYRAKLIEKAAPVIATSPVFARYRR